MKIQAKKHITEEKYELALQEIERYEIKNRNDREIYLLKSLCYEKVGQLDLAKKHALLAVKELPYVVDAHYQLGYIYQLYAEWMKAYEQYSIAEKMLEGGNPTLHSKEQMQAAKEFILDKIASELNVGTKEQLLQRKKALDYIIFQEDIEWAVRFPVFRELDVEIIGKEYMDYFELDKLFLGITGTKAASDFIMGILRKDAITEATEMQRVSEQTQSFEMELEQESYVPIIMAKREKLSFDMFNASTEVSYTSPLQYTNYRLPKGKVTISSREVPFRVGEIIPIKHSKNRKRLILNIFVDGLSQTVLGDNFEKLMPHTYRFFKKGLVCENTYTAGDWTFPSIASIMTGQTLAKHKMLHSKQLRKIDLDTPILFEYFKNAGYNTTKIGGNWRIAPNYGYTRGMNRVFYNHMYEGYSADHVIAETEEQIYRMRDTDQFIWMEIGELHLIADEVNMAPIQSEFMVWENSDLEEKINSVKQNFDTTKIKYYLKQVEYIDRRLASLYQYIEENFNDDEILVSLFSDHGQGYLVKKDDKFLADERTKIAFMFRGNGINGMTDEPISACDYTAIMCQMAQIDYNFKDTDANLPVSFGGNEERQFVVTESIHVGDPYQIVLNGRDFQFYLEGKENVTSECRVPLQEYDVYLLDEKGVESNDRERIEYYRDWCLDHVSSCVIY